jgi:hypothetical protein
MEDNVMNSNQPLNDLIPVIETVSNNEKRETLIRLKKAAVKHYLDETVTIPSKQWCSSSIIPSSMHFFLKNIIDMSFGYDAFCFAAATDTSNELIL